MPWLQIRASMGRGFESRPEHFHLRPHFSGAALPSWASHRLCGKGPKIGHFISTVHELLERYY